MLIYLRNFDWLAYLRELNLVSVIIRLSLAVLFGGLIGMERGLKNRAAGFKTHILVCIGSTLAMLTNQYINLISGYPGDPSRLGAQVISGIGFLGAGTILVTGKQQIKGLTTAAGLWACACMGLAIGIGFYEGAIFGCLFIFGVMTILNKLDQHVLSRSLYIDLYIELSNLQYFKPLLDYFRENGLKIVYIETSKSNPVKSDVLGCFVSLQQQQKRDHQACIALISNLEGVEFVEEI